MNSGAIIFGILPLLVFVIVDSFSGMKAALIWAVVFALAELIFSLVSFGEIDAITIASFFLVALMAFMAWKKNSEKWFLFQPVILSVVLGIYVLINYWLGHPLWFELAMKYKSIFPEAQRAMLDLPQIQRVFIRFSFVSGFCFIAHGAATAYAAMKLNKWWWIAFRGVGFYAFMFIGMILSQINFVFT